MHLKNGKNGFVVDILKNLTKDSKYNVKDAIEFKNRVNNTIIGHDEVLISFDVISLFPSIPVNLALNIIKSKWHILEKYTSVPQQLFMDILSFCIKDTRYFRYGLNTYEQLKGMPMGSPASPVIADIVMEELIQFAIEKMPTKPRKLTKYVDDLFAIVKKDEVEDTLTSLNSFNRQIQFTKEEENNNVLPYLDSIIKRQGDLLKVDWYQKLTCSGRLINFYSKHPRRIIINTATNFIRRVLGISDKIFHKENLKKITETLIKNEFPRKTIRDLIEHVKNKNNNNQNTIASVEENVDEQQKIYKSLTYIPGLSERLRSSDIYNKEKYNLALKTGNSVNKLFSNTKSKIENEEKSNLIYKINCNGDGSNICNKTYVGTTKTKLKNRISSHKSDLKAVNKPVEQKTALAAHCTKTGHKPNFDTVSILQQEDNYKKRFTLEMLFIINTPTQRRLNYKTDTEKCAQIYRHTIDKHKRQT